MTPFDPTQLLSEAAKQVPNLAVLAFIVFLFLKHLRSYNHMIHDINKENISAREQSRVVIEENTRAVAKNTEILHQIIVEIGHLKNKNKNHESGQSPALISAKPPPTVPE